MRDSSTVEHAGAKKTSSAFCRSGLARIVHPRSRRREDAQPLFQRQKKKAAADVCVRRRPQVQSARLAISGNPCDQSTVSSTRTSIRHDPLPSVNVCDPPVTGYVKVWSSAP